MAHQDIKNNLNSNFNPAHRGSSVAFRRACAVLLIITSVMIFTGWSLRLELLIKLRDVWPPVAPLSALNFFFVGIMMLVSRPSAGRTGPLADGLIIALAGTILFTSSLMIARHLLRLEIPVDILIFKTAAIAMNLEYQGMMAPATALCFFLTGLWFIADFVKPRFDVLKSSISLFVLLVASLMFGAYLYGASSLYQLPVFFKMSALTAFLFSVIHIGLLSCDPPFGIRWHSPLRFWRNKNSVRERPLFASLLVVFTVFIIAGIATSRSLNGLIQTIQDIAETQTHLRELDRLMIGLLNAESGQRGFLVTGHDDYLDSYFQGTKDYEEARRDLRDWVHDNPQYAEAFGIIEDTAKVKLTELGESIVWRRAQGLAAAQRVVVTDVGRMAMVTIRDRIQFIKDDQLKVLLKQKDENRRQVTSTITSITVGSLLATLLLLTCLNLYVRNSLQRSEVEDEVRHLNSTLEGKLHEIEVVNKELESFSYSVSHDLRAPLRAMAGFSNILIEDYEDKLDDAGRAYLRRIIAASDRMSRLIDGILDLSRISRRQVLREDVRLSELAEQIIAEMRATEPARDVEVLIEPNLVARGDNDLVGSILQNLLANAWKFTSKKPSAHITFGAIEKKGKQVFFVRDDGAGFDMAYIEKLFGTFQRLHTEEDFKGTGVGLATVRRIAHLHGGEVWAEGAVGQGATFYFTLES